MAHHNNITTKIATNPVLSPTVSLIQMQQQLIQFQQQISQQSSFTPVQPQWNAKGAPTSKGKAKGSKGKGKGLWTDPSLPVAWTCVVCDTVMNNEASWKCRNWSCGILREHQVYYTPDW